LIQTAVTSYFLTDEQLEDFERKTYDSHRAVDEELQAWRNALNKPPTEGETEQKRRELEEQERRGILRVYPAKPN
jgi:hypothetical protein